MYLVTLDITSIDCNKINTFTHRRDRIVVSTLRCGRNNPGSNPGHGTFITLPQECSKFKLRCRLLNGRIVEVI